MEIHHWRWRLRVADYLAAMHIVDSIDFREVEIMQPEGNMVLDQTTLRNLELTQTLPGEKEGSLLERLTNVNFNGKENTKAVDFETSIE